MTEWRKLPDSWRTAVHEAGHAVVARVLTIPGVGSASIVPDHEKGAWGLTTVGSPGMTETIWAEDYFFKGGRFRQDFVGFHAHIIAAMAGAEAEKVFFGKTSDTSDSDDREYIAWMLDEIGLLDAIWEHRFRRMTRMLVRRHRATIERVASALLLRKSLTGEEVNVLVGLSGRVERQAD